MLLCAECVSFAERALCPWPLQSTFPTKRWLEESARDDIFVGDLVVRLDDFTIECVALLDAFELLRCVEEDVKRYFEWTSIL